MNLEPESWIGTVCVLFFAVVALLTFIESWRGFGPGPVQQAGMSPPVDEEDDEDDVWPPWSRADAMNRSA